MVNAGRDFYMTASASHPPEAVSYTHLDVYKRQLDSYFRENPSDSDKYGCYEECRDANRKQVYVLYGGPVSYTHLDVYKRQGQDWHQALCHRLCRSTCPYHYRRY